MQCCGTIYLTLFEVYNLIIPELKVVIIKHYLRNIACGDTILNIVNLKKLLKTILNDT